MEDERGSMEIEFAEAPAWAGVDTHKDTNTLALLDGARRVMGTWRPLTGTSPYIGEEGKISCEPELKVEVTIRAERLQETIRAIKSVHPYEEPVINAIPLWGTGLDEGE